MTSEINAVLESMLSMLEKKFTPSEMRAFMQDAQKKGDMKTAQYWGGRMKRVDAGKAVAKTASLLKKTGVKKDVQKKAIGDVVAGIKKNAGLKTSGAAAASLAKFRPKLNYT